MIIRPGDTVFLMCKGPVSDPAIERFRQSFQAAGLDVNIAVVENVDQIVVYRPHGSDDRVGDPEPGA
jgi:hypothetical protein